jgi:hypothetical protein
VDTDTEKNLSPACGDLQIAVALMAVRYANAVADWTLALDRSDHAGRKRFRAASERRFWALQRITAALARR